MSHQDLQKRWDDLSGELRRNNPPLFDPTKINIPLSASNRIRFEPNSRDAMNSRIWESMQYDTKEPNSEEIKNSATPIYMDMNPISARNKTKNYIQEQQYYPDIDKQSNNKETPVVVPSLSPGLIKNPYLQRLDPVNDARNIPREMRSAVYEDNRERDIDSSRLLAERQFTYRHIPEDESAKLASIQAYELLRPKVDDYKTQYEH